MANDSTTIPDAKIQDTQEDFENNSQVNAGDLTEQIAQIRWNKKRTGDAYQNRDLASIDANQRLFEETAAQTRKELAAINNVTLQALQNSVNLANKVGVDAADNIGTTRARVNTTSEANQADSRNHANMAADAAWTDPMSPVARGAGNDLTGQSGVNASLASTASLATSYTNISAQLALLTTLVTTQAQALATNNSAIVALLAQMVQNAKQTPPATAA